MVAAMQPMRPTLRPTAAVVLRATRSLVVCCTLHSPPCWWPFRRLDCTRTQRLQCECLCCLCFCGGVLCGCVWGGGVSGVCECNTQPCIVSWQCVVLGAFSCCPPQCMRWAALTEH